MAGRKPTSTSSVSSAHLPIEIYHVSFQMKFNYGAKIPQGMKRKDFRTHLPTVVLKEQAESFKEFLVEQGEKDVKLEKITISLPSICPNCKNSGSPTLYKGKGTLRKNDTANNINRDELRLIYNHSKTKPKTCIIGTVNTKTYPPQINLKSKFKKDVLLQRYRVGEYPLPKGFTLSE